MKNKRFIRWDRFVKTELDPAPPKAVGIQWIADGEIEGRVIGEWPYVDMDAWRTRQPIVDEVDLSA